MPKIRRVDGKLTVKSGGPLILAAGVVFFLAGLVAQVESINEFRATGGAIPYSVNDVPVANPSLTASIGWLFFSVIFWTVGATLILYGWNSRFEIDNIGIKRFDLFGRRVADIQWPMATSYGLGPGKGWVGRPSLVLRAGEAKVEISKLHQAWPLIDGEILRHVPQFKNASGISAADITRKNPDIPVQGLSFRPTGYFVIAAALIGFAIVFLWFSISPVLRGDVSYFNLFPVILAAVPLLLGGFALVAYTLNAKVVISEECITRYNMFGQVRDKIAWRDVIGFEHESTSSGEDTTVSFYMIRSSEDYMRLSSQTSRWPVLKDAIMGMLPNTARVDLD